MNRERDRWQVYLDETHEAVCAYASAELDALARRAITSLQRMPASGIFDEYPFKTIWDEYCHEVQQGPNEMLEWAWDETIRATIYHPINTLPRHVATLISIGADYELTNCDDELVAIHPDLIFQAVKERVDRQAVRRNMDRFEAY